MKTLILAAFFASCALSRIACAKAYIPLGALERTPASASDTFLVIKAAHRSIPPAVRPRQIELIDTSLHDAIKRTRTERAATHGTGTLGNGLRGNILTGLVTLGVDTGFSIRESGGASAFQSAGFYTHLGGEFGGWTLELAVELIAAPLIVEMGGFSGPFVDWLAERARIVGYMGGEWATRKILEAIHPAFLDKAGKDMIKEAREHIEDSIATLQRETPRL